mgnify:CR=1 FL=1
MPFLPEAIWRRRVDAEYTRLRDSGERFQVNADKTRYVISVAGPGLYKQGSTLTRRFNHDVEIVLKREYPYAGGIEVVWLTPIFHPNIREDGRVCIHLLNEWSEAQTLDALVNALRQLLKAPNYHDALNKEAADYFAENNVVL